jgi:hypothetical protein
VYISPDALYFRRNSSDGCTAPLGFPWAHVSRDGECESERERERGKEREREREREREIDREREKEGKR